MGASLLAVAKSIYCILKAKEATLYGCRGTLRIRQPNSTAKILWSRSGSGGGRLQESDHRGSLPGLADPLTLRIFFFTYNLSDEDDVNCGNKQL